MSPATGRVRLAFRVAALTYAVYGLAYFAGAAVSMTPALRERAPGGIPWWSFFVAGGLAVVVLPVLLWQGRRWLALVLGVFVMLKAAVLGLRLVRADGGASAGDIGFAALALVTALVLLGAATLAFLERPVRREHGARGEHGGQPGDPGGQ